jgi:hypothetical protein
MKPMSKLTITRRVPASMLWIVVAACFVALSVVVVLNSGTASAKQDHKIEICHKGNTISVDVHAVPAHLEHGDLLGPCGGTPGCACGQNFDPVTCADGNTYANECFANCAGAPGPCTSVGVCSNIFDPVRCNGVVYANACQARLAGCPGPFDVLCPCGQIYAPVRCADGNIYVNACVAQCQGAAGCVPLQ